MAVAASRGAVGRYGLGCVRWGGLVRRVCPYAGPCGGAARAVGLSLGGLLSTWVLGVRVRRVIDRGACRLPTVKP